MTGQTKPKVFFVLGGPGSGKSTVCSFAVKEFGFTHFSAGDLLREKSKNESSDIAKKIAQIIRDGGIVPSEITVELLLRAIAEHPNPHGYIIDGFPRKEDQARMFEEGVVHAKGIFYLFCTEEVMEARLLKRAKEGSGRADDNIQSIRNRFRTDVETCMPVVSRYKNEGRLYTIDATRSCEEVYADVRLTLLGLNEIPLQK